MIDDYEPLRPITIVGDASLGGTYVLRLHVEQAVAVQFGRFGRGQPITVPAGECLYVGSAMRGLGARLLRHASRMDADNPHPIRVEMAESFVAAGLVKGNVASTGSTASTGSMASTGSASGTRPALSLSKWPFPPKHFHWHIDYLLEKPEVELTHVMVLRSRVRLETAVADWLVQDPATFIIALGLGARDNPGSTHLLGIRADETWWVKLLSYLNTLDEAAQSTHNSSCQGVDY